MPAKPEDIAVRQEVEDVVVKMFVATDERDWTTLESCFTDPFILDMTNFSPIAPVSVFAERIGPSPKASAPSTFQAP